MQSYKDLTVYQKGVDLSVLIYQVTQTFPKEELYSLVSQLRRCSVSIPSNIAEGQRRGSRLEYIHFLRISFGSGAELETQLLIAYKVGYINLNTYNESLELLDEVMKMLNKLISVLEKKNEH